MAKLPAILAKPLARLLPVERDASLTVGEWASMFSFGGLGYPFIPSQTLTQNEVRIDTTWTGYANAAMKGNGPVFACIAARMNLFSEATFSWQRMRNGQPGALFGTQALSLLEQPWVGGSTRQLLSYALLDADLAGNAFFARTLSPSTGQTVFARLRPDWVTIVLGSNRENAGPWSVDSELIGYIYDGQGVGGTDEPRWFLPHEVAHFAPMPDPVSRFRGMSWLSPVVNEILGDNAATQHKLQFFRNGATPNMVVSLDPSISPENFERWQKIFEKEQKGIRNAYKTLFLGGGADTKVVGADMKQIDFKVTQGHGETRLAAAAGVPPVIAGFSEGLEAATYANYSQARRRFADGTVRPLWGSVCAAFEPVVDTPSNGRLWYSDRDISFLQEDLKDAAEIQGKEASTIVALIRDGFEPESVLAAVQNSNWTLLKHTGMVSVQLRPPGETDPAGDTGGDGTTGGDGPPEGNGNGGADGPAAASAAIHAYHRARQT